MFVITITDCFKAPKWQLRPREISYNATTLRYNIGIRVAFTWSRNTHSYKPIHKDTMQTEEKEKLVFEDIE